MSAAAVPLMERRMQRSATLARAAPRTRSASRTRSFSRTRYTSSVEVTHAPPEGCICQRPSVNITCLNCGWNRPDSRTRILCPVHTMTFYLYDVEFCPSCRAYPPILMECDK